MKLLRTFALLVGMLSGFPLFAQDADAVGQAKMAATTWVSLADAGQFGATWDQAANLFQTSIAKPKWEAAMHTVRTPLGTVKSRKLKSAVFTKTLPGAPEGEYVVVQFDTQFESKAAAVETITPMKGKDGAWRVSGYFIK